MKANMSSTDRITRLVIVAVLVALYATKVVTGTFGIVLLVVSAVFALTSTISFCPLYAVFGVSTCPRKKA